MSPLLYLVSVTYVLFLVFIGLARGLLVLFFFFFLKEPVFGFTDFLYLVLVFNFIDFCFNFYSFFSSADFALLFPVHSPLSVPLWSEAATSTRSPPFGRPSLPGQLWLPRSCTDCFRSTCTASCRRAGLRSKYLLLS